MDRSNTELTTIQIAQENITNDDPFSKYWESSVPSGPARDAFWEGPSADVFMPEVVPHLQHHNIQSVLVDPLCLSNVPGAIYNSQHSDDLAPWFISEPISCSLMVGDLDNPMPSLSLPPLLDYQQVQEELTEVTSMNSQPAVANVHGGELAANFCEPGTVFLTLDSPIILEDDDPNMAKDANLSGFSNQLTQYNQTAGPSNGSRDLTSSIYPEAYLKGAAGQTYDSRLKKPCHCTRSLCLKLYCECFANGVICTNCDCSNCHNNAEHEPERSKAVKSILVRNPDAFKPKFASGNSGEVKSWHNKGCNCKRSYCLKNYCECFEANILCCPSCKCVGCKNSDCPERTYLQRVVTPAVVEAVCDRLLTQAEKAKKESQSSAEAERMILNEFGSCLTEIVKAMFKTKKSAY